ncbi:SDR family NAD(P)-dependent oxidoreductase [Bradyrhizobium manausense]
MASEFDLSGKVALVTGAARGLGAAASVALARAGATIAMTDVDEAALLSRGVEFQKHGWSASADRLDVTDDLAIKSVIEKTLDRHGRIDILLNNAGVILRKPLLETSASEFRRVLDVNLVSMFSLAAAVSQSMIARKYGRIINLSSIMGHVGRAGQATYVAAKHGVVGLTKSLAAEFGPHGITSNAVAPGYFYTEMNRQILDDRSFHDSVVARTPLRRWAEPDELGGTIVFLASPASGYVTGQTITLDGGMTVTVPGPQTLT